MSNPSKQKGTAFETMVARFLTLRTGLKVERLTLHGSKDLGDLGGVTFGGEPVVIECKNAHQRRIAEWMRETERERKNAGAPYAALVVHEDGAGWKNVHKTSVYMDLKTFRALATHSDASPGAESRELARVSLNAFCEMLVAGKGQGTTTTTTGKDEEGDRA